MPKILPCMRYQGNISSKISRKHYASKISRKHYASELQENLKEMFPSYLLVVNERRDEQLSVSNTYLEM